ncbi:hypothetical protein [Streptomyces sp. NPDC004250]|uniref:hypothetical protein n=1 Tax=Streptomyces sp. NPDC004250 TaxID=3364692 RepID=UPI003683C4F4
MSAPLVINLKDGSVWERRAVSRAGVALYALAGTCACPEYVMASESELAELGIAGSADALPMPVGPSVPVLPETALDTVREILLAHYDGLPRKEMAVGLLLTNLRDELLPVAPVSEAALDVAVGELSAYFRVRVALASAQRGRRELRAELHTALAHGRTFLEQRNAHAKELLELRPRVAELEAAQGTVYRAEHPDSGITLGHYSTAKAARDHCEALMRRDIPGASLDWLEDEEDGVAELVAAFGEDERSTGYIVTALELDSEYDPEADE